MTLKQKDQFNKMLSALKRIANEYETPEKLLRLAGRCYGLDGHEAVGYAYENMQYEAKSAIKGVREVK